MLDIEDNFHQEEKYYVVVQYSNYGNPFLRSFEITVPLDEPLNCKTVHKKICEYIDETEKDDYIRKISKPADPDKIISWSKIR